MSDISEVIPAESEVALDYRGRFNPDIDCYEIETGAGGVRVAVTLPLEPDPAVLATVLIALPQVIEAMVQLVDEEIEARADG